MATTKVVQKLDCIKIVQGHEVYYVDNGDILMIFQEETEMIISVL